MTQRNVTRVLAGMEDLLCGVGTQTQTRNGQSVAITKADICMAVATVADMQALDVTKYTRARVYTSASNVAEYLYDAADNTGYSSDTGPGSWVPAPDFAAVLSVDDRISLRDEEPTFNHQLAVALGDAALGVGAGGVYWYDESDTTTADDGADVFVTTGGARWKRVFLDADNPTEFVYAGGTTNALTATFGLSAVPEDRVFCIRAASTNSGTVTLDIDGTGALAVKYTGGAALNAGAIEAFGIYFFTLVSGGGSYRLINPSVSQADAEAGTLNKGAMTPLRVQQWWNSQDTLANGFKATTQISADNSTKIATTAFVQALKVLTLSQALVNSQNARVLHLFTSNTSSTASTISSTFEPADTAPTISTGDLVAGLTVNVPESAGSLYTVAVDFDIPIVATPSCYLTVICTVDDGVTEEVVDAAVFGFDAGTNITALKGRFLFASTSAEASYTFNIRVARSSAGGGTVTVCHASYDLGGYRKAYYTAQVFTS